ncbi:platelet-activating factor acetylhydrolase isoform X2 [Cyanistes caeruleus]|uniref:1-alkyl-2-acetylglycerophosphocholine esterase n=1 Tax=Cyanistes caeruleus TaxID=156563 RepID=A0A8C0Z7Q5_CYACU|nr:platelet-activating factor acetylhydrolase isoform X2 [Cyanistes caeruleus]
MTLSLPYRGTAQHLGGRGLRWDAQALLAMAPCQKLAFQAQGRFLPRRLSQLETKAKFGPSPSGRARQSLCLRQRRPPVGAAAARPAPEGRGWPEGTSCCSGQRDGSRGQPGHRITGSSVKAPMEMWSTSSTEKFYRIPEGKGPHSVGCTDLMTENAVEGSFLRLYYPAYDATDIEEARWIPDKEYYQGLSDFLNMYRVVGERLFHYYVGSVTCPAKSNAAFKPGEKYPLLVFSHGLGAFRTIYSAICIEMASQGFIVAAVEHRDESASATYYCKRRSVSESQEESTPNMEKEWIYYRKLKTGEEERCLRHKQVQQRAQECIKALNLILKINSGEEVTNVLHSDFDWNSLKDSVDTSRIAVMGHSFGGATVIESLSKEIRFRCGIALDVWMLPVGDDIYQNSVQQPLLFINSEKFQWAENILKIKKLISNDTNKKMITIKGSVHQSFPDFTFVSGGIIARFFKLKGEIDPNEAIDISNHASLAFLQKHLSLKKDFDQWDSLVDGIGPNVIPGTNIDTSPAEPE